MSVNDAAKASNASPTIANPTGASRTSGSSQPSRALEKVYGVLSVVGLGFLVPIVRLVRGENPPAQLKALWKAAGVPVVAVVVFLLCWSAIAPHTTSDLGSVPTPSQVWQQAGNLWKDHLAERDKERLFYQRQAERNAQRLQEDPSATPSTSKYTGKPTFIDQVGTSLNTVFTGFVLASLVAIPLGILCGLSTSINSAVNPFVQIFKPVSPLAWLPIVTLVVNAAYNSAHPIFAKSYITSAATVAMCSMWATLINTALGVSSIDKDLINVARVLNLSWTTRLFKLVLPASLPLIFTGLRLSLGVGWMVLIAAEMLAQNPGLGKFLWDEYQNGNSDSLSRMMVAVFAIGIIGFLLDRLMFAIQTLVNFSGRR